MDTAERIKIPVVSLWPMLDLATAEPLHRLLQDTFATESGIVLDGSQVERVSTACLQLLVAASRTARSREMTFTLQGASPALMSAVEDLALSAALFDEVLP